METNKKKLTEYETLKKSLSKTDFSLINTIIHTFVCNQSMDDVKNRFTDVGLKRLIKILETTAKISYPQLSFLYSDKKENKEYCENIIKNFRQKYPNNKINK